MFNKTMTFMFKRTLVFCLFLAVTCTALWAGGRREANQSWTADDPSILMDVIDTSEHRPGRWNFFVEATDRAGNVTRVGAYNITIDPASDIPGVAIINPVPNMHVQGNLNIVGIAYDDDGVDHVWLVVTRGRDGMGEELVRTRAEGSDYWSFFLDTTDSEIWTDGEYTITAWAVDINGLSGISEDFPARVHKTHSVTWNLDRRNPQTVVTSHYIGELVAGRVRLRGEVHDGNGVRGLSISLDGGETFIPVRGSTDRRTGIFNWDITIDTNRTFEDGAAVIWFRAVDGMGSVGSAAHLLFINNNGPAVEIVYPDPALPVNGIFTIAGFASHPVGMRSVTWSAGRGLGGEFELIPGNHWWSTPVDIRGLRTNNIDIEIRATDISGNVTVRRQRFRVDQNADLPVVELQEPVFGAVINEDGTLVVKGHARDNEGVASIFYSIGPHTAVEIPTTGYFQFMVTDIPGGIHTLEVWAVDVTGVTGPRTIVRNLVAPGSYPELRLTSAVSVIGRDISRTDFYSGMEINNEIVSSLDLVAGTGSGIATISYQFGGMEPVVIAVRGGRPGDHLQSIPIPANIGFGQVSFEVTATDNHGRTSVLRDYIFVTNLTAPRPGVALPANRLADGPLTLVSVGDGFSWPTQVEIPRAARGITIPITAALDGEARGARIALTVAGRPVSARLAGNTITANLPLDLPADQTTVTMTVTMPTGETHEVHGSFWVLRPHDGRQMNVSQNFTWVRPVMVTGGRILMSTDEPLLGLFTTNTGRALQSATIAGAGANNFNVSVDHLGRLMLQANASGTFGPLTLTITDGVNNTTFTTSAFNFIVDTGKPRVEFVNDPDGNWVQNQVPVSFRAVDGTGIAAVEVSMNMGESWQPLVQGAELTALTSATVIQRTLDISSVQDGSIKILIRVTNLAGRTSTSAFTVLKDTVAPQVNVVMPIADYRVNGTIRMGFSIAEAGSLGTVTYHRPATPGQPAINIEVFHFENWEGDYAPLFLEVLMDALLMPLADNMSFIFTDRAGNSTVVNTWEFMIAPEDDIPVVHIILPEENEVITTDFIVSGIMFDDDGISHMYWRLNNEPWQRLDAEHGFSIPISLSMVHDNENTVSVFAEDIFGVTSEPVVRTFRVSLSEPEVSITFPLFDTVLRDTVEVRGTAFDENRIQEVFISIDNGNSFNRANITARTNDGRNVTWVYRFNTRILHDGAHVVFVRVYDNFDIPAVYASMINVDNTPPEIIVDSPLDGFISIGSVSVIGRVIDPNLQETTIEVRSLDGFTVREDLRRRSLGSASIIRDTLNFVGQPDGLYNIEIVATDRAGNVTRNSSNIVLARQTFSNFVDILYPLDNENVQGHFNLYGVTGGVDHAGTVTVRINGVNVITTEVNDTGFFRFSLNAEHLRAGENSIVVHSNFGGTAIVESQQRNIIYSPYGPWVTIDNFSFGDFAYERPFLTGRFGYELSEEARELLADRNTPRDVRNELLLRTGDFAEISFNNGQTFTRMRAVRRDADFSYRLETGEMTEGIHHILVRATMRNGEQAFTRMLVQVDHTPPYIRLISPEPGGVYNTAIAFSASATDNVDLVGLTYHLRRGDRALYEVPGFLQGLYVEMIIPPFMNLLLPGVWPAGFVGATFMDIGVGLSFFDDNVKVQFNYGFMTQRLWEAMGGRPPAEGFDHGFRYGGNVIGLKLLANLYSLPFGSFLGPDWNWLSATFAVGANFSLFSITQSGSPTWMSALLFQVEFPRVTLHRRSNFRTFSFFTEAQLWFVPTDVDTEAHGIPVIFPHVKTGLRMYIF